MATWLVYALGSGWGHLNRAIALGRKAAQQHQVCILTNSPYAHWIQTQIQAGVLGNPLPSLTLQILSAQGDSTEISHQIQEQILNTHFDCLIVDTFPRGLGGELATCLPNLRTPKVLVHRALNPHYVHTKKLVPWVEQQYDLILVPGEQENVPFTHLPQAIITAPWLMWSDHELKQIQPVQLAVVVIAAGNPDELAFWGEITVRVQTAFPHVAVHCLAFQEPPDCPEGCWIRYWPGMAILQQATVLIGGAGYNTVFEAKALGIPLIALPFRRRYDRQSSRAMRWAYPVETLEEAISTLSVLLQTQRQEQTNCKYANGVDTAISLIAAAST